MARAIADTPPNDAMKSIFSQRARRKSPAISTCTPASTSAASSARSGSPSGDRQEPSTMCGGAPMCLTAPGSLAQLDHARDAADDRAPAERGGALLRGVHAVLEWDDARLRSEPMRETAASGTCHVFTASSSAGGGASLPGSTQRTRASKVPSGLSTWRPRSRMRRRVSPRAMTTTSWPARERSPARRPPTPPTPKTPIARPELGTPPENVTRRVVLADVVDEHRECVVPVAARAETRAMFTEQSALMQLASQHA